jgi:hypothetical protein
MMPPSSRVGARLAVWALAAQTIGCSGVDSNGTRDGGGGEPATGGTAGHGGAGTGGASSGGACPGGSGNGAGGSGATQCPAAPPVAASACKDVPDSCFYEDCGGVGRVSARCTNGLWVVEKGTCRATTCGPRSTTCSAGQACVERAGGALLTDCTANHCNGGPVQCDCIEGCSPGCSVTGGVYNGIFVTCNTCPSGQCP